MNYDELSSDLIELTDFTLDLLLVNQADRPSQVHDFMQVAPLARPISYVSVLI